MELSDRKVARIFKNLINCCAVWCDALANNEREKKKWDCNEIYWNETL